MTSEVEERPRLVTGSYRRLRSQWVNKKLKNPNFVEFLAFSSLVGIVFSNVAQKDPSFGKLGHMINVENGEKQTFQPPLRANLEVLKNKPRKT